MQPNGSRTVGKNLNDTAHPSASQGPSWAPAEPFGRTPLFSLNAVGLAYVCLLRRQGPDVAGIPTEDARDRTLLQLRRDRQDAGPSQALTLRWKEVASPQVQTGGAMAREITVVEDPGWQPLEGCIHGVQVLLDVVSWRVLADFSLRLLTVALENFHPPPFENGWCRIALHGVELDIPYGVGVASPAVARVSLPALMLSSVPGVGELFSALDAMPGLAWPSQLFRAGPATSRAAAEDDSPGGGAFRNGLGQRPAPVGQGLGTACACYRELQDGQVKVACGFGPVRHRAGSSKARTSTPSAGGEAIVVLVSRG